jgi:hypothetical protein
LITITQGYDYAIPSFKKSWSFRYPLKILLNKAMDNGCWLMRPLKIRGIFDPALQRALVMTFIYEYNQIFIELATKYGFDNVYHLDCRGLAYEEKDWHDELHYKSYVYEYAARAYTHIIRNHDSCEKVVRAVDFRKKVFSSDHSRLSYEQTHIYPYFYLVIKYIGTEKCIEKNINDVFASGNSYNWKNSLAFNKTNFIKNVQIRNIDDPAETLEATVYSD